MAERESAQEEKSRQLSELEVANKARQVRLGHVSAPQEENADSAEEENAEMMRAKRLSADLETRSKIYGYC